MNVEGYEVWKREGVLTLRFVDLFGDGEQIEFPVEQASRFFMDLGRVLAGPDAPPDAESDVRDEEWSGDP